MNQPLIHQFTLDGYHLVLDVNSGTLHAVTELVSRLISVLEPPLAAEPDEAVFQAVSGYDRDLVCEAYGEIRTLWQDGTLWGAWDDALSVDYAKQPVKSMCLHVAHDCNMHCDYCFAGCGHYHGESALMPLEVACAAMDFLFSRSENRKHLEVDFFGGEPLLNLDVVKGCVAYTREREKALGKEVRFTLTTNALELDDETAAYLNREMHNLVFSIDGRRETHEAARHTHDDTRSYDRVLQNIRRTVAERGQKSWYARGTYTHKNRDFRNDVIALADAGLKHLSLEPVVLPREHPLAIRESDVPSLLLEYERLAREIIHRERRARKTPPGMPFSFFHYTIDLDGGPCAYKRLKGCGSGTEYLAVAPDGSLYPCHQFVGEKEFLLGDVFKGITRPEAQKPFCRSAVLTQAPCKDCFAKYFCSGGCAANNYHVNQALDKPYEIGCQLERKRLECALMIKASLAFDRDAKRERNSI